jgi:hypothetical protein
MMKALFESIFGCLHTETTWPQTPKPAAPFPRKGSTYVVCVRCGARFSYDWERMKMGGEIKQTTTKVPASIEVEDAG